MSHSSMMAQQMGLHAMRQGIATAKRAQSQAAAGFRHAQRLQRITSAQLDQTKQKRAFLDAMIEAATHPLDCQSTVHSNGAKSLLLERNWIDPQGTDHVILQCNVVLPGSGRPAAVFLWTDEGLEQPDLVAEGLGSLLRRGRLFLFPANSIWPTGEKFAVLPGGFEGEHGAIGYWGFANAGLYRGQIFMVGASQFGSFISLGKRDIMVARPLNYSAADRHWIWYGRSSISDGGKIQLNGALPIDSDQPHLQFLVPTAGRGGIAALRCSLRDDRGDPIALLDTKSNARHIIRAKDDTLYLLLPANRKLPTGEPIFVAATLPAADGTPTFSGSGHWKGEDVAFELEANHKDGLGKPIFLVRAKAVMGDQKVAAVALKKLGSSGT